MVDQKWESLIGAFLINFGAVEMISYQWIDKFSTDSIVRDIAMDLPLSKRLKLVCELIQRSRLSDDRKRKTVELWDEVVKISMIRNIIAHDHLLLTKTNMDL